jgi:hypothetical protein
LIKILIALLLLFVFFACAAKTGEAQAQRGKIHVVAVTTRVEVENSPGGREGDTEWLRWSIRDRFGRTIGRAVLQCGWHRQFDRYCTGEIRLPSGKLTVAGASETRSLGLWAVTGGTGRYSSASGELRFVATGIDRLTITITI